VTGAVMQRNEGNFVGVGRLRLQYRTWEVADARAAVIVVHGLSEHSGRYEGFGEALAMHGCSTFAFDMRGHGNSEGRRGHVPHFGCLLQDLDRFRREVQGLIDVRTPLFLLGHSMGGLIALRYQEQYDAPFHGAIVVSPWLATAMPVPRWKVMLANALTRLLPALPFSAGIDAKQLSRDPAVVAAYAADPLVHDRITPRLFVEASSAMGLAFQGADRISAPLLFLIAGSDGIVDTDRTIAFARSLSAADVTIHVFAGHYHELLNEPDREDVIDELADWMMGRLA
jgi:lysophospholipase